MENKRFNTDSKVSRKKILNIDGTIEHLLPKFLLSDLIDKSEREDRIITDSTRDENFGSNFSNIDLYDSHEENDPILDELKVKDVIGSFLLILNYYLLRLFILNFFNEVLLCIFELKNYFKMFL